MKIAGPLWLDDIVDKLAGKHRVEPHEVEELLQNHGACDLLKKATGSAKICMRHMDEPMPVGNWWSFSFTRKPSRR